MPLTGSDRAYKQARSGIERSGASRTGFFTPNVVITINSVDRTTSVIQSSLSVSLVLNDEPDTARFTLEPGATIPTVGQTVSIALGSSSNPIFAGQIARVLHRRLRKPGASNFNVFVDVECLDWMRLFDRTVVNATYTSESASTILADLVDGADGFTGINIEAGLPTIDYIAFTNERRSTAVRRVITLMGGGGFYIDPSKDLHAFGAAGETTIGAPTNPLTLTNTSASLQSFSHEYEFTQVRNRVVVEGQTVPAAVDHVAGVSSIIVESGAPDFDLSGGRIRIGTKRYNYASFFPFLQTAAGVVLGMEGVTTVDAAAGATTLTVADTTEFNIGPVASGQHWLKVAGQYLTYTGTSTASGAGNIQGIPATGFGSMVFPIWAGTAVHSASYFKELMDDTFADTTLEADLKYGEPISMLVQADDAASQAAMAAIEGGDGIHEHVISDGRLSFAGATARAEAELESFKDPLTRVTYVTDDMNATVGAQQAINLTTTDPVSETLTITNVELTFPVPNYLPQRRCQASTVRLALFKDMAIYEET